MVSREEGSTAAYGNHSLSARPIPAPRARRNPLGISGPVARPETGYFVQPYFSGGSLNLSSGMSVFRVNSA